MSSLTSRKQLLIAESELNRAQLVQEWQVMTGDAHALVDQAKTLRSILSASAALMTGLLSLRRKPEPAPAGEKSSWLQSVLKGAGLAASLWSQFRPQGDQAKDDRKSASRR